MKIDYTSEAARVEILSDADNRVEFCLKCSNNVSAKVFCGNDEIFPNSKGVYKIANKGEELELNVITSGMSLAQTHQQNLGLNGEKLNEYNSNVYMNNFWQGDTVYHEAVMFADTSDGTCQKTKTLLYPIDDVVSVRSYDLKKWYVKDVDYKIKDGKLIRTENSDIPLYTGPYTISRNAQDNIKDETLACFGNTATADFYNIDENKGLYLIFEKVHEEHAVYVTYTHSKKWKDGFSGQYPKPKGNKLTEFYSALKNKNDINVLVFGDSVAAGGASSGQGIGYDLFDKEGKIIEKREPYGAKAPAYFIQATQRLVDLYGNKNKVNYYNIALGGTTTTWGKQNIENRLKLIEKYYGPDIKPNLIYLNYSANDLLTPYEAYKSNMEYIFKIIRNKYPNASILLVSGKVNNEKSTQYVNRKALLMQEKALIEIAEKHQNSIAVEAATLWCDIVKSKDIEDYLCNNINHANDFWARGTAMAVVSAAKI